MSVHGGVRFVVIWCGRSYIYSSSLAHFYLQSCAWLCISSKLSLLQISDKNALTFTIVTKEYHHAHLWKEGFSHIYCALFVVYISFLLTIGSSLCNKFWLWSSCASLMLSSYMHAFWLATKGGRKMSCPCLPLRLYYFVNSLLIKVPIRIIRKLHGLWCELFLGLS